MANKRQSNKLIIGITVIILLCLTLFMCSSEKQSYEVIDQYPQYSGDAKPKDGDTQADTIKALQAYAKEAVGRAKELNKETRTQATQVIDNKNKLEKLKYENKEAKDKIQTMLDQTGALQGQINTLTSELKVLTSQQTNTKVKYTEDGIPIGFGFDEIDGIGTAHRNKGEWYEPIDRINTEDGKDQGIGFSGLLKRPGRGQQQNHSKPTEKSEEPIEKIEPVFTLPKDATLTDALSMTALIGRIPVEGKTPDPYPVKIFIGKENLLANGHELPEVEGMIFSGLGFGDWNLSCVSARLYSATFIFTDGSIVNHSNTDIPLGYISDPVGVPCVSGRFVSNATQFILQRTGLAGLGAAGAAYSEAQQQTNTSALGATTRNVVGDINKLVAGNVVKSATDEVSRWLLERQQQSFDAVVVEPGVAVSVHLNQQLTIDHKEFARRLRYERQHQNINSQLD